MYKQNPSGNLLNIQRLLVKRFNNVSSQRNCHYNPAKGLSQGKLAMSLKVHKFMFPFQHLYQLCTIPKQFEVHRIVGNYAAPPPPFWIYVPSKFHLGQNAVAFRTVTLTSRFSAGASLPNRTSSEVGGFNQPI